MPRPPRNLPVEVRQTDNPNVPAPVQDTMDYRPTDSMLKLRAEFFALEEENPLDLRDVREKIREYFPTNRADQIIRLMDNSPAFENWFQGTHEFKARVKYLADKALAAVEDILNNPHPAAANARIKAAQFIIEMAGKSPKVGGKEQPDESTHLMKALNKMDRAQVEALLSNGTEIKMSIKSPETLDTTTKKEGA